MMQAWKDPHRTSLGQLIGGCTLEYTVWRRRKIEDAVPLPARMQVSIPNPDPIQPSKVNIVRLEFPSEKLEMEQKYLKLQEKADKAESNAQVYECKA